ncbi:MAG: hypothetical protein E7042_04535 [Lentisphaerae bacterium]|nr:hypothetical protein [Lentisphaerota bacterium]
MSFLKIKNTVFKLLTEIFVFDRKKRKILKARWAKKHVRKYVDAAVSAIDPAQIAGETSRDCKVIWQYWHQGVENAPLLIQKCFESVKKFHPDWEVRILSFDTIGEYVTLPEKYYDLLAKGKIPIAIFSDVLRLYLLREYGGLWIDSTIFLTDRLNDDILDAEFMVMQKDIATDPAENIMSCFFIRSKSNALLLEAIRRSIENYWQENDYLVNYFIFEHIATMLAGANDELKTAWAKIPFYSAEDAGILQTRLFDAYDEAVFNEIKQLTSIHKLTYKKSFDHVAEDSFYKFIINSGDAGRPS